MDIKNRPEGRFFSKLESLVARSGGRSGRRCARVRGSSRCRGSVSGRGRSRVRSSSRCRGSVSRRCRRGSCVACRGGSLVARLAASGQSQRSHQGSEEEGFLHDHVLLWIKVSNSANVTVMFICLTPTLAVSSAHTSVPHFRTAWPEIICTFVSRVDKSCLRDKPFIKGFFLLFKNTCKSCQIPPKRLNPHSQAILTQPAQYHSCNRTVTGDPAESVTKSFPSRTLQSASFTTVWRMPRRRSPASPLM